MFLQGIINGIIKQRKIERDILLLISKKESTYNYIICALINLGNWYITLCSFDNLHKYDETKMFKNGIFKRIILFNKY